MEINHSEFQNCDEIKVSGRIDSYTSPLLSSQLNSLIHAGKLNIILDLKNATYISSAGLRVMIDVHKTCRRDHRGEIVLLHVPLYFLETLRITGFLPMFQCFSDQASAKNHFVKINP